MLAFYIKMPPRTQPPKTSIIPLIRLRPHNCPLSLCVCLRLHPSLGKSVESGGMVRPYVSVGLPICRFGVGVGLGGGWWCVVVHFRCGLVVKYVVSCFHLQRYNVFPFHANKVSYFNAKRLYFLVFSFRKHIAHRTANES